MNKRTKIIKTRCKYKDLCGQNKKIILLFIPRQLTPLLTPRALFNCQKPLGQWTCLKLHVKHVIERSTQGFQKTLKFSSQVNRHHLSGGQF